MWQNVFLVVPPGFGLLRFEGVSGVDWRSDIAIDAIQVATTTTTSTLLTTTAAPTSTGVAFHDVSFAFLVRTVVCQQLQNFQLMRNCFPFSDVVHFAILLLQLYSFNLGWHGITTRFDG